MAELDVRFRVDRSAPRRARQALDRFVGRVADGILDNLRLLVSELVTNSVRHAGLGDEGWIRLSVRMLGKKIRVEVVDPGSGFEPDRQPPTMYQDSGWGLFLVQQLSDRWGVNSGDETRVWFEIDAA